MSGNFKTQWKAHTLFCFADENHKSAGEFKSCQEMATIMGKKRDDVRNTKNRNVIKHQRDGTVLFKMRDSGGREHLLLHLPNEA